MTPITNCPATGKKRVVTSAYIIREPDGNLRTHFVVDCFEDDGITRAETVAPNPLRICFAPARCRTVQKGDSSTHRFLVNPPFLSNFYDTLVLKKNIL